MGTDAWMNWRGFLSGNLELQNFEEDLQSDREFEGGSVTFGPYLLEGVVRLRTSGAPAGIGSAIRLRFGVHADLIRLPVVEGALVKANSDSYHGGGISDEIAALVCLALGVRLRAAGMSRMSLLGDPSSSIHFEVPRLAQPGPGREYIPEVLVRPADLRRLECLESFPVLDEGTQVAVIKAARSYAAGLWWANEDPNQAWLHLVTAVEVAAQHTTKVNDDPVSLVHSLWPELWTALGTATSEMREDVCKLVAPQMRATKKFIQFLTRYSPEPPLLRPQIGELDWEKLEQHVRVVYGHRSKALHEGRPFPLPMLESPRVEESGGIQEVPSGLNASGQGGIWDAAEFPMLLSTFEYIVQGALVRWWLELLEPGASLTTGRGSPAPPASR